MLQTCKFACDVATAWIPHIVAQEAALEAVRSVEQRHSDTVMCCVHCWHCGTCMRMHVIGQQFAAPCITACTTGPALN